MGHNKKSKHRLKDGLHSVSIEPGLFGVGILERCDRKYITLTCSANVPKGTRACPNALVLKAITFWLSVAEIRVSSLLFVSETRCPNRKGTHRLTSELAVRPVGIRS